MPSGTHDGAVGRGAQAQAQAARWQEASVRETAGHTLTLWRVRLFGFTELATFLCQIGRAHV